MTEKLHIEQAPEQQYPVTRQCSWCKKDLGLADYTAKEPGEITHTICEDCKKKYFAKYFKEQNPKEEKKAE